MASLTLSQRPSVATSAMPTGAWRKACSNRSKSLRFIATSGAPRLASPYGCTALAFWERRSRPSADARQHLRERQLQEPLAADGGGDDDLARRLRSHQADARGV